MQRFLRSRTGFTLIELIIVVSIISLLAAVAVPNFLEAQARSKVSRVKADMRTIATALEAYAVDWGTAPRGNFFQLATIFTATLEGDRGLILLSTPTAYLTQGLMTDPFQTEAYLRTTTEVPDPDPNEENVWYKYSARDAAGTVGTVGPPDFDPNSEQVEWWILQSSGPDRIRCALGQNLIDPDEPEKLLSRIYDPTNGSVSRGSIYRIGGTPTGERGPLAFELLGRANR